MRRALTLRIKNALARIAPRIGLEGPITELAYRINGHRRRRSSEQLERLPRALYLEATNICNAKCIFCAYPQMKRSKSSMSMELFAKVVTEYVQLGGKHVSLTPIVGDPTVDTHLFERLDLLQNHPEIESYHFFTNAILLTETVISRLLSHGERLRVAVSMGGFDRRAFHRLMGVDRFDTVWHNLQTFVAQKGTTGSATRLEIHVRCGPSDRCGPAWETLLQWRHEGRVEVVTIDDYDSWAGAIDSEVLARNGLKPRPMPYKRGACELLFMKPVVLADGRVNGCACRDAEAELIVGDLNHQTLNEVLDGAALAELRRHHHANDYPEVCQRCTYYTSIHNPLRSRLGARGISLGEPD